MINKTKKPSSLSFIPQAGETVAFERKMPPSLVFKISIFAFAVSFLFLGFVMIYKTVVVRQIEEFQLSIDRAKASFDPTLIAELEKIDNSITGAQGILVKHRLPLEIFDFLEINTHKDIWFSSFNYTYISPQKNPLRSVAREGLGQPQVEVRLEGESKSYLALAEQSEIFNNKEELLDFAFSNFSLTQEGNISFSLTVRFQPSVLWPEK